MGSMVSGLADAVLGVVESVGLSADTVARYRKCCGVVVKFCEQRGLDAPALPGDASLPGRHATGPAHRVARARRP